MYEAIVNSAEALKQTLTERRRDLHRHAESGWMEMRTSSLIARALEDMGYEVLAGEEVCKGEDRMGLPPSEALDRHYAWAAENGGDPFYLPKTKGGFTGVIGILRCGSGPTVALRFDIDALGVTECPEESHRPSKEGFASMTPGVMHACGHDGHASIGLGTAKVLMENRDKLHGTVKLIFQPAEEGVRGAKSIVTKGHLEGVDYVLAGHVFPEGKAKGFDIAVLKESGSGGLATSKLDIAFHGRSAHAGISPQEGKNALLAAATAALNLHAIPRFGNTPTQINVGRLTAGTGRNVVCEDALLEVEVRGQTTEANDYMEERARRIAEGAALMQDCSFTVTPMGSAAALSCDWPLGKMLLELSGELKLKALQVPALAGGSEDFAYMAQRVQQQGGQAIYFGLLTPCAAINHNDRFDFDEKALITGVKVFCAMTLKLMNPDVGANCVRPV